LTEQAEESLVKSQKTLLKAVSMLSGSFGLNWAAADDFRKLLAEAAKHIGDAEEAGRDTIENPPSAG
jgi:hypothetical protein